jgi:IK cytokine
LLEQTKARVAQADDDDSLEDAFRSASSSVPKKRTREDIIRELKEKRSTGETGNGSAIPDEEKEKIEKLKQEGKFKPIGFKPFGSAASSKSKDSKDGTKKKKKRKVDVSTTETSIQTPNAAAAANTAGVVGPSSAVKKPSVSAPAPELEPMDEDFDIFADAGEYEGIDFGDEDEDDVEKRATREEENETSIPVQPGRWFADDEPELIPERSVTPQDKGKAKADGRVKSEPEHEAVLEQPARLMPLASSAVPSIRDMLAADEELEREEKRRARKEKKKAGGGGGGEGEGKKSAEAKLDRDYQKLKSYQEKKKGG